MWTHCAGHTGRYPGPRMTAAWRFCPMFGAELTAQAHGGLELEKTETRSRKTPAGRGIVKTNFTHAGGDL